MPAQPDLGKQAKRRQPARSRMMRCWRHSTAWWRARRLAKPSGRPDSCGIWWKQLSRRSHLLKESVLGAEVFGRPATWDLVWTLW